MLFRFTRDRDTLQHAVRAAVAAHSPQQLRELLANHGETAFAGALSYSSGRVIADALSMLPKQDNERVGQRLSPQARSRYTTISDADRRAAHAEVGSSPMQGLLVWQRQA